jgi:predicted MFS family arabinose efflux permease
MPTFRIVLVGSSSLALAMGIGRFAFTPLLPLMRDDGLVSIGQGGLLASIHFLGYWLGAMFAARLSRSPNATLRFSLIAIGVSTLGMGLSDDLYIWSALRWLSGVCSALSLVLISNYTIKYLANIGHAEKQGWVFAGVGLGIMIAGLGTQAMMMSAIGSALGWQIFGVMSLVAGFVICAIVGPELDDAPVKKRQTKTQSSPLIWNIIIPYGALGIGYIIPATYLPVMARDVIGPGLWFGWAWPIFGAAAFVSTLLAVRIQIYYSNRQIWAVSQIIMAAGLAMPVIYGHISTIVIAGICVGGTFMIITMMGIREAHRLVPEGDIMRHLAVMTAAFASGQMIGPVFASSIFELTESFSVSLGLTSIILVVTVLALLRNR